MDWFPLINRPQPIKEEDFTRKKNPNYKNINTSGGIKIVEY